MQSVSVVIPIKDERDNLRPLHERLVRALDPLGSRYELVFVDDGSTDGSLALLEELAAKDRRVKVVALRRNFGQTPALQAGIDWSSGDVIVTMDGDLTRPMHAFGQWGLALMAMGFLSLITTIWMRFQGEHMVRNPFLLLTVLLELMGVQFLSIGLIGELLTRTYHESQGKPAYQVKRTVNLG